MRQHPGSVNLRYLAAPTALVGLAAGTLVGVAGAFTSPWLLLGFAVPGVYVCGVLVASVVTSRGLAGRARALLAVVYPTMHICWGAGFLSSIRSYRQRGPQ
jgi:succinoglycan biosynthesis protein ExoA